MGGKNSGRFKKGMKLKKNQNQVKKSDILPQKTEPTIELVEETFDFDSNADRILKESQNFIQVEKSKSEPESKKTEPENQNTDQPDQNQKIEPEIKKQKEDWSPVVGFFMNVAGQLFESSTGFKEMNYTEDEIEKCAPAASEIINVLWPDIKALTEEQKILILNSMTILKVHVDKLKLLNELKKQKAAEAKTDEPTRENKTEQKAA